MKSYIEEALEEAKKSFKRGEVPIGCVIVKDGKVLSKGRNKREKTQNALHHAEVIAINKACKKLHSWRLDDCELYVTLAPCPMCAGAIANARIKKVVYGAKDNSENDKIMEDIFTSTRLNHKVEWEYIENTECSQILTDFFRNKRKSK